MIEIHNEQRGLIRVGKYRLELSWLERADHSRGVIRLQASHVMLDIIVPRVLVIGFDLGPPTAGPVDSQPVADSPRGSTTGQQRFVHRLAPVFAKGLIPFGRFGEANAR
jgi:hypothetical protein